MLAVANVGLAQRTWLGSLRRVISCNICHRPVFPRQFVMDDNWEHVVSLICADLLQNAHKSVIETKLEIAKELTLLSKEVSMPLIKPDSQTLSYFSWFVGVFTFWNQPKRAYSRKATTKKCDHYQNGHTFCFIQNGHLGWVATKTATLHLVERATLSLVKLLLKWAEVATKMAILQ